MSILDLERRLEEAQRERARLQTISGSALQDLARLERNRMDTISEMRRKYETEVTEVDRKLKREIDDLRKSHDRTDNLLRSNNIMVINAERELENARKNESPNEQIHRRRI